MKSITKAFKSLCLQAGQAILNSAGNLKKAGESLCKWSTVKNMGKAVVLAAIAPVAPGNEATWTQELQYQFLDKTTSIGVDVLFGEKLEDSFKSNVRAFGSDFIGAELAKRIGKVRQTGEVPDILLNLCHGVNAGIQGWIRNNDPWSGAFGAFMAETFVDIFSPERGPLSMKSTIEEMERQKGDKLTREEFLQVYNAELKNYANACKTSARELMAYSRMTTAVTSMLIGLNPEVSDQTGSIALENNYSPSVLLAIGRAVLIGASIASGAYEAYQISCAYNKDGIDGVMEHLVITKIEEAGTKIAFKFAGITFKTAAQAVSYAISKIPGADLVLKSTKDDIIRAAENLGKNALNKLGFSQPLRFAPVNPVNVVGGNNTNKFLTAKPVLSKKTLVGTGVLEQKELQTLINQEKKLAKKTYKNPTVEKNGFKFTQKEQPWTIRDNQDYKSKIIGRAQHTGTSGHASESYRIAIEAAKDPETLMVLMNRGYNRIPGIKVPKNRRPDVMVIRKDGRIDVYEVQSKTDRRRELIGRNEEVREQLPKKKQGEIFVLKPRTIGEDN